MANQGVKEKALSKAEIDSNCILFLMAGSETTATLLSGVTYLLLKNLRVYKKLIDEMRDTFKTQGDITIKKTKEMKYLRACLLEALRYYPPVPTGFPRLVPRGGDVISGTYIPEGVSVKIPVCCESKIITWVDGSLYVSARCKSLHEELY